MDVVLCCDPKAFTHSNPLSGIADGGAFVWESDETPEAAWRRIPQRLRHRIIEKKIRLFTLPGFEIARSATDRPDLQLRMQGNAFLGAFFGVSPFLEANGIDKDHFEQVVRNQYDKKFGRFGDAVVESNMTVMTEGFARVQAVPYGDIDAPDESAMRGESLVPCGTEGGCGSRERSNLFKSDYFDAEYRAGLGYRQPASPLASVGVMAAATGATASKYVARRETPVFIAENCTQCMACIAACPDTALPNTAQDLGTILSTAAAHYVTNVEERAKLVAALPDIEARARDAMNTAVADRESVPLAKIVGDLVNALPDVSDQAKKQFSSVLNIVPLAYNKVNAIYRVPEKKNPGAGGVFSIFVSDLCKGCGECVTECGDHMALRMETDSEALNATVASATGFMDLLPDTDQKYLGLYDDKAPQDSRQATLRNHLMVKRNYQALVSGDGACAGCGEKSVLHAVASLTEAYMRPIYHARADRLDTKAAQLDERGVATLEALQARDAEQYALVRRAIGHCVMGLGGESDDDTEARLSDHPSLTNEAMIGALTAVMRQEAFNHRDLQALDGRLANGMAVMAMGANTGCNTVYGSTPPNNPHPYPWMNSLFQDGPTISWMLGESFMDKHGLVGKVFKVGGIGNGFEATWPAMYRLENAMYSS